MKFVSSTAGFGASTVSGLQSGGGAAMRGPILCSSGSPWGIHANIVNNLCHRCGWSAGAR